MYVSVNVVVRALPRKSGGYILLPPYSLEIHGYAIYTSFTILIGMFLILNKSCYKQTHGSLPSIWWTVQPSGHQTRLSEIRSVFSFCILFLHLPLPLKSFFCSRTSSPLVFPVVLSSSIGSSLLQSGSFIKISLNEIFDLIDIVYFIINVNYYFVIYFLLST